MRLPTVPRSIFATCLVLSSLAAITFGELSPALAQAGGASAGFGRPVLDPQKKAEAKAHFDKGADLYAQGAYDQALVEWTAAYEISQHPLIFESMANAYERLGKPREAKDALAKWRAAAPADEHEMLDRRIQNLDARIKKLDVEEAAAEAAASAAGTAADEGAEEEGGLGTLGIVGVIVGGAGVGLIAGGVVVGIVASGQRPDEEVVCRSGDAGSICLEAAREDIDSSSTLALVSDIMWITGAVATAAGGTLLVLDLTGVLDDDAEEAPASDARSRPRPARAELRPLASPAGAGLSLQGTW